MSVPDFLVWHCANCGAPAVGKNKPCDCSTNVGTRAGPKGQREQTWWDDPPSDWQQRYEAQAKEYKLARERLLALADEALRRDAEFRALATLMDEADDALDKDTYDQKRRDEFDTPDDAEWWISAGTERKCVKVFTEIDRIRRSMDGGRG
jgi:hypothetical protein